MEISDITEDRSASTANRLSIAFLMDNAALISGTERVLVTGDRKGYHHAESNSCVYAV